MRNYLGGKNPERGGKEENLRHRVLLPKFFYD